MPSKPCTVCGELHPLGHPHLRDGRDRSAQRRFRAAVLKKAGNQCQYVDRGRRCSVVRPLQAHHLEPGNNDPNTGVALCAHHHREVDPHSHG